MKRSCTLLLSLCLTLAGCSTLTPTPAHPSRSTIDTYLRRLAALGFSGQVLVAEGDQLVLSASYGYANRETRRHLSPYDPMAIASLSKQFTAAAVLRLVDQGKLGLNDNIERHLPKVPADKVGITIHDLLTHTSGFRRDAIRREEITDRSALLDLIYVKPLRAGSEEAYQYSNSGYQLLAALVEEVSGTSFDDFVTTQLFEPAGLDRTGLIHSADGTPAPVRAYNEWMDVGTWTDWTKGWKHRGSGGQVSTATDLFGWWRALKTGNVLSDSLVAQMFTPHVETGESTFYGYGWELRTDSVKGDMVLHGGDNLGFHSELRWRANGDHLVIILTNLNLYDESGGWLGLHKRRMASNLLNMLTGDSTSNAPGVQRMNPSEMSRYIGRYELPAESHVEIWASGDVLWLGAHGQDAVEMFLPTDSTEAARRMELNFRSQAIMESVRTDDQAAIEKTLKPGEVDFFWIGLRNDWQSFVSDHGPFASVKVAGSVPQPWDPALVRTQVDLVFGSDTLDYHFTWSGDDLYETISELGRPSPLIVPLAKHRATGGLTSFDHVTEHSVDILVQVGEKGVVSNLEIAGRTATRREE
jgi:CubicO group peptidase (beta-lactamase class C family)